MVIFGGSAGALNALLKILPGIDPAISFPIVIVLHRKNSSESSLGNVFSSKTSIPVRDIEDKESIVSGTIYIAPPDYHLLFEKDNTFSLDFSEKVYYSRPSIDVAFESAAEVYGSSLSAILLSGANEDGTQGLKVVKDKGGNTCAQDPETAEVSFMPQHAILNMRVDEVLDLKEIISYINSMCK